MHHLYMILPLCFTSLVKSFKYTGIKTLSRGRGRAVKIYWQHTVKLMEGAWGLSALHTPTAHVAPLRYTPHRLSHTREGWRVADRWRIIFKTIVIKYLPHNLLVLMTGYWCWWEHKLNSEIALITDIITFCLHTVARSQDVKNVHCRRSTYHSELCIMAQL